MRRRGFGGGLTPVADIVFRDTTNGGIIVRQVGGVAGTDELRIYHNGDQGVIQAMDGRFVLTAATQLIVNANGSSRLIIKSRSPSGDLLFTGSGGWIGFSSQAAPGIGDTVDTGLVRVAAGVVGPVANEAGSTAGFIQNTAGDKRVAADGTNVTTTPATTGLSVTVAAARHYAFECVLYVEDVTAADGLRVDFDGGTATMAAFIQNGQIWDTAGVRSLPQTTAIATDVTDTTTTGAAMAVFKGFFSVTDAGTFIPRYAKEADAAGATITLRRGSHLRVWDVA